MQPSNKYAFSMIEWENIEGRIEWATGWVIIDDGDTVTIASHFELVNNLEMVAPNTVDIPKDNILRWLISNQIGIPEH